MPDFCFGVRGLLALFLFQEPIWYNFAMNTEKAEPDFASLYQRAFKDYGASALWSSAPVPNPTPEDALSITRSLRVEGDRQARLLAEQIERACRATV